jgi:rhodanese-related sulfurtransferase
MQTIRTITREELSHLNARVFEVLPYQHWAAGHIPGAKAMPLDRIAEVARSEAADQDAPIVLYCASDTCKNSHIAAEKLTRLGYRWVFVYAGGKADWKAAGLALERALEVAS